MKDPLRGERVLLVHPGIYDASDPRTFPPWGALMLATELRELGADVHVADLNGRDVATTMVALYDEFTPTVVGITAKLGLGARRAQAAVAAVRAHAGTDVQVAVGGPLVSSYPELDHDLWTGADALFWGDGEDVLARWIATGVAPALAPHEAASLDTLGLPSWWDGLAVYVWPAEFWPNMGVRGIHVASGRGCTRRCTFCYLNAQYPGTRFRFISPGRLMDDLDTMANRLDVQGFYFVDDCFIDRSLARVSEFCDLNLRRGSPYRYGCDVQIEDLVRDDLLDLMYQAGFRSFYLGIETASERVRRLLAKSRIDDLAGSVRRVLDRGFTIRASIGIGWPTETAAEIESTLGLVDSIPELAFDAYRYLPLPAVPLTRRTAASVASPFEDYSEFNTNHSALSSDELDVFWHELVRRQDEHLRLYYSSGGGS